MSIISYFSNDPNKRAKFIFNLIAPIYKNIDKVLYKNFRLAIKIADRDISLEGKTVLDLGCGTGAWSYLFKKAGAKSVHGIDFAEKMVNIASNKHPELTFSIGNIENLSEIASNSYDIVTASYVMHGVTALHRAKIMKEMQRIGKSDIIIQDFVGKTPFSAAILEFLEQSDYKNFKKHFAEEITSICTDTRVVSLKLGSGLYFGKIK